MQRFTTSIFAASIFLGAFLLFQVQPITARLIQPIFGGTATVWTACMMYFQVVLLLGYVYAHLLRSICRPQVSAMVHAVALLLAWMSLRFTSLTEGDVVANDSMVWSICWRLTLAIGLPFFVLSATGPLIQAWHSCRHPQLSTYRLYALSNAGSLLALLGYPILFDPLGVSIQQSTWAFGFGLFFVLMVGCGCQMLSITTWHPPELREESGLSETDQADVSVSVWQVAVWIVLSATASLLLLSATNILCQEIASFPFLWIWPLILYLLSLILCFDRPQWYRRRIFQPLLVLSVFVSILLFHFGTNAGLVLQVIGSGAVVFTGTMVCHGELTRLKPPTERLTLFYLTIATGGALGSILAVVVAPRVFSGYFEFHVSLLVCLLVVAALVLVEYLRSDQGSSAKTYAFVLLAMLAELPVLCSLYYYYEPRFQPGLIFRDRNEYGIVSVSEDDNYRKMFNGQTNHGGQFRDPVKAGLPSAYYSEGSGAARAFSAIRRWRQSQDSERGLKVGVIGLGTGSLVSYGEEEDRFRFYEINPLVDEAARAYFSYLETPGVEVILGDGRRRLTHELSQGGSQQFDILFVDAFSSDSIPIHLLTSECLDIYLRHLRNDGIIVFHITNKLIDLRPVIAAHAEARDLEAHLVEHVNTEFDVQTRWALMTSNKHLKQTISSEAGDWVQASEKILWTDDKASLGPIVIWSGRLNIKERSHEELP